MFRVYPHLDEMTPLKKRKLKEYEEEFEGCSETFCPWLCKNIRCRFAGLKTIKTTSNQLYSDEDMKPFFVENVICKTMYINEFKETVQVISWLSGLTGDVFVDTKYANIFIPPPSLVGCNFAKMAAYPCGGRVQKANGKKCPKYIIKKYTQSAGVKVCVAKLYENGGWRQVRKNEITFKDYKKILQDERWFKKVSDDETVVITSLSLCVPVQNYKIQTSTTILWKSYISF